MQLSFPSFQPVPVVKSCTGWTPKTTVTETDNYRHLAYVVGQEKGTVVSPYNGRKVRVLHADNGKSYHQFSDWSVKEAV